MKVLFLVMGSVALAAGQALSGVSGTVVNAVDGRPLPGESVSGLRIELAPGATISGRVVDLKGQSIGASVTLTEAQRNYWVAGSSALSGEFRLEGLVAGEYKLSAQVLGVERDQTSRTYFPNQAAESKAETIRLSAGQQRSNIVIVVQNVRSVTVEGVFTGERPPGGQLSVLREARDGGEMGTMDVARLDENGRFTFKVRPGEFRLKVMSFFQDGGQPLILGFSNLSVGDKDLDNVVIPAAPMRTIRAKMRGTVNPAQEMKAATIRLNPHDGLSTMRYGKLQADGWIVAPTVSPGIYGVTASGLPPRSYIRAIRAGSADITQTGLNLVTGTATDLEIELAEDGGKVTGQIVNAAGQPIAGGRVAIISASPHRAEQELWSRSPFGDKEGQFAEADVAPGEYTVTARANGKSSPAQTIRVTPHGVTRLQLVIP